MTTTTIEGLEANAALIDEAAARSNEASIKMKQVVHGDSVTTVETESGSVPTLAKQARDAWDVVLEALENLSMQMAGAAIQPNIAEGLRVTADKGLFSVASANEADYLDLYQNNAGVAVFKNSYPSTKRLKTAIDESKFAVMSAVAGSLSPDHPWAITDRLMRIILGVRKDGVVDAILDRMPGLSLLGDYAWQMSDKKGVVLLGVKWSGDVVVNGRSLTSDTTLSVWEQGPVGQRDIWALVDSMVYQLTSSGDNTSPQVQAGSISYVERKKSVTRKVAFIPEAGVIAGFVKIIWHLIYNGQSLQCGIGSGTPSTQQAPTANRLLTIKDGVQLSDEKGTLSPDMVAPFQPMAAKTLEPPALQVAAHLNRTRSLPSDVGLLTSMHGRGGQSILALNKGTIPYGNSITAMTEAKAECMRLGYGYKVPFVGWNQGQHDGAWAAGLYLAALVQLQIDYQADIQAITGQVENIPLLLTQMSNWTAPTYKRAFSNIPHEQLQAALDYPDRFVMAGPQYWMPSNNDGIHLPASSYARDGVMVGRAASAILNGFKWMPLHCVEAIREGNKVDVRFHVPSLPLVIDTVNVTDPGNYGIRWIDSTDSATVTAVEQIGSDTLRITLSGEPTGADQKVGIADIGIASTRAGPTTGPRTCIRDSAPDLDAEGVPVFNWACHQRFPVTII